MSKQFLKSRGFQQKMMGSQTWGPGQHHETNNIFKLAKPPRRISQQFMTTQHQYEQSNQQYNQSNKQSNKSRPHRRNESQFSNTENQEYELDAMGYGHQYKTVNNTPHKIRRNESKGKMVQSTQSNKQIQQRFKQIESIMGLENENLRQQKDYLLRTIYKMQIKQKEYKNQIAYYQDKAIEMQQQNKLLRQKYQKARDFIASGIDKMQQVISKQQTLNNSNSKTAYRSNESSINVTQQIEQLNDKFDALMFEYQKTRQPEIRKKCMEIAKELRKLRKSQEANEHLFQSGKRNRQ